MNLVTLQEEVKKLKENIEETVAYERRDTVILPGTSILEFSAGENCMNVVRTLLK